MLAKLRTFSLLGIDAVPVEVEVDVSPGALPKTVLVGLPEAAVKAQEEMEKENAQGAPGGPAPAGGTAPAPPAPNPPAPAGAPQGTPS